MKRTGIFEVDTKGMRDVALRRGLAALVLELFQNAVDEPISLVDVCIRPTDTRGQYEVSVEDDSPDGFRDLAESYTMYAPSYKREDAEKRGQFNIGEKFVIAACEKATIFSTKGGFRFDDEGRHRLRAITRKSGTIFTGIIRTNQKEVEAALETLRGVIVPQHIIARVNGVEIGWRKPITSVTATLPTMLPGDEGIMRPTRRQTTVSLYTPRPGEPAMLYEMGLPVVETGDAFDIDVAQRVPLNQDRDNVTPSYLAAIRAVALNAAVEANELEAEHVSEVWVKQAAGDERATDESVRKVMDLRFGTNRVAYDMSDSEANKRAVENGATLVYGRSLSGAEWTNAKRANAIVPAGQKFPSSKWSYSDDPEAPQEKLIPESAWTPGMQEIAAHAQFLACELLAVGDLRVKIVNEPTRRGDTLAAYAPGSLIFNAGRLGFKWFDKTIRDPAVNDILIHEFAHHYSIDHLSRAYHDALSDLGARMVALALERPEQFFR